MYYCGYGLFYFTFFMNATVQLDVLSKLWTMLLAMVILDDLLFLQKHYRSAVCSTYEAMDFAANNGHLDVLHFLHEHYSSIGCTVECYGLLLLGKVIWMFFIFFMIMIV